MEQLKKVLEQCLTDGLYQIVVSNPRRKEGVQKIKVRPVMIRGELLYQESRFIGTQVFHENVPADKLITNVIYEAETGFRQVEIRARGWQATALIGRKGNLTLKKKKAAQICLPEPEHNRKKKYILDENVPVGFLQDLGIQTAKGHIIKDKFNKFKQINRFLEFIEDVLPSFPSERPVKIIDFGCGKSYLTFAMYYYLKVLKQYDVEINGLDRKADVIDTCSRLSAKYGYENLHFHQGDIKDYMQTGRVDMVVTLHACDTATDYALEKAVKWGAEVILCVPCCQHELNAQMQCAPLQEIFSYGLIKERAAALFTDALRGQLLEAKGYDVQILEFIDMEHTPKNIMLRCVKRRRGCNDDAERQYRRRKEEQTAACMEFLQVQPTLAKLFQE